MNIRSCECDNTEDDDNDNDGNYYDYSNYYNNNYYHRGDNDDDDYEEDGGDGDDDNNDYGADEGNFRTEHRAEQRSSEPQLVLGEAQKLCCINEFAAEAT